MLRLDYLHYDSRFNTGLGLETDLNEIEVGTIFFSVWKVVLFFVLRHVYDWSVVRQSQFNCLTLNIATLFSLSQPTSIVRCCHDRRCHGYGATSPRTGRHDTHVLWSCPSIHDLPELSGTDCDKNKFWFGNTYLAGLRGNCCGWVGNRLRS